MYHNFLIYSSADGHLGCFHVLVTGNSAAMNIGVHMSLSILVSLDTFFLSLSLFIFLPFFFVKFYTFPSYFEDIVTFFFFSNFPNWLFFTVSLFPVLDTGHSTTAEIL